jgi:anti-anti-sigma factor
MWGMTENRGTFSYQPDGKIDESNWQSFSESLIDAVEQAASQQLDLVVNLANVPYMSSRGLRALTLARKAAADRIEIVLAAPDARLREILAISRYDKIFRVEDSVT